MTEPRATYDLSDPHPPYRLPGAANKYHARRVELDGYTFDSQAEARRYGELRLLEQAGRIARLEVHPSWLLEVNGRKIGRYTADFRYLVLDGAVGGKWVVEDLKSQPTRRKADYRLRVKLLWAIYGIRVREVEA